MQVFCPYPSPLDCAKAMWGDSRRYNKQIIECHQILDAIDGVGKGWFNHPVTKMYKPYRDWLYYYTKCLEAYRGYRKSKDKPLDALSFIEEAKNFNFVSDFVSPPFLTDEFCDQHKRRLFTKSPDKYPKFAEYGTSEENWYFVDCELLKYVNGKRI